MFETSGAFLSADIFSLLDPGCNPIDLRLLTLHYELAVHHFIFSLNYYCFVCCSLQQVGGLLYCALPTEI